MVSPWKRKEEITKVAVVKTNLTPVEAMAVKELLLAYGNIFPDTPGRTQLATHKIRTETATPIKQRAYRTLL